MRRSVKYMVYALAIILIVFLSVDIHRLDSARARPASEVFDVEVYVTDIWENYLPEILESAVEINSLVRMLKDNPDETFENHSNKLGISNTHYFMVRAAGVIETVDEETVIVDIGDNLRTELELSRQFNEKLRVRLASVTQNIETLSGGNQQKVVIAKWLATNPRILLLDEPTRGIDVGARQEIYGIIEKLASEGMGIIVVSSNLPEILSISDRIMVLSESRMTACIDGDQATEELVMKAAIPGKR